MGEAAVVRAEANGEHLDPGGARVWRQVGLEAGDSRRGEALEADELASALGGLVVGNVVVVVVVLVVIIAGRRVRASAQAGARKGGRAHASTGTRVAA